MTVPGAHCQNCAACLWSASISFNSFACPLRDPILDLHIQGGVSLVLSKLILYLIQGQCQDFFAKSQGFGLLSYPWCQCDGSGLVLEAAQHKDMDAVTLILVW